MSGGGPLFPGTIDLNGETLIHLTLDVLEEFCRDGIKKIFVNNAHFENEAFILEAIDLVSRKYPDVKILESNWWDVLPQEVIDRVFEDVEFPGWALEHAAVTETSLMMYLRPDLVREEYIPGDTDFTAIPYHKYPVVKGMVPDTGALASARGSSAEKGRLLAETAVFCPGFPWAKNTSIRTTVRIVGYADNECGQCGCSAKKPQRGFFDGLRTGKFSLPVLFMC